MSDEIRATPTAFDPLAEMICDELSRIADALEKLAAQGEPNSFNAAIAVQPDYGSDGIFRGTPIATQPTTVFERHIAEAEKVGPKCGTCGGAERVHRIRVAPGPAGRLEASDRFEPCPDCPEEAEKAPPDISGIDPEAPHIFHGGDYGVLAPTRPCRVCGHSLLHDLHAKGTPPDLTPAELDQIEAEALCVGTTEYHPIPPNPIPGADAWANDVEWKRGRGCAPEKTDCTCNNQGSCRNCDTQLIQNYRKIDGEGG